MEPSPASVALIAHPQPRRIVAQIGPDNGASVDARLNALELQYKADADWWMSIHDTVCRTVDWANEHNNRLNAGLVNLDGLMALKNAIDVATSTIPAGLCLRETPSLEDSSAQSGSLWVQKPDLCWDAVGGLEEAKRHLQAILEDTPESAYPRAPPLSVFTVAPSRSVLLYGPEGNGKTMIAHAFATEFSATLVSVNVCDLIRLDSRAADMVSVAFSKARSSAPSVLFFDQFDLAGNLAIADRFLYETRRTVNMESKSTVVVLAASSRPFDLDAAVIRSFDEKVFISYPSAPDRQGILERQLRATPVASNVKMDYIAQLTDGFSGRMLAELCRRATKAADHDARTFVEVTANTAPGREVDEKDVQIIAITCEHFEKGGYSNGVVKCTSMGGVEIATRIVPSGQDPYGPWLQGEIFNTVKTKNARVQLMYTSGEIFWTSAVYKVVDEVTRRHFEIAFASFRRAMHAPELAAIDRFRREYGLDYEIRVSTSEAIRMNWPDDSPQDSAADSDTDLYA